MKTLLNTLILVPAGAGYALAVPAGYNELNLALLAGLNLLVGLVLIFCLAVYVSVVRDKLARHRQRRSRRVATGRRNVSRFPGRNRNQIPSRSSIC